MFKSKRHKSNINKLFVLRLQSRDVSVLTIVSSIFGVLSLKIIVSGDRVRAGAVRGRGAGAGGRGARADEQRGRRLGRAALSTFSLSQQELPAIPINDQQKRAPAPICLIPSHLVRCDQFVRLDSVAHRSVAHPSPSRYHDLARVLLAL